MIKQKFQYFLQPPWLAVFLILFLPCPIYPVAGPQTTDAHLLKAKAMALFTAYAQNKLEEFLACWHPQSPVLKTQKLEMEDSIANGEDFRLLKLDVINTVITPTAAQIRINIEAERKEDNVFHPLTSLDEKQLVLRFRQFNGVWLVWQKLAAFEDLAERVISAPAGTERQTLLRAEPELIRLELIRYFNRLGNRSLFTAQPNYERAAIAYNIALQLAQQFGNAEREAVAHQNIGLWHAEQSKYDQALKQYELSLTLLKSPGDDAAIAGSYDLIGSLYTAQKDFGMARSFYEKSLQFTQTAERRARVFNNLAVIEYEQGNHNDALKQFQEVRNYREELRKKQPTDAPNNYELALVLANMGRCFIEKGDYWQALSYLLSSRKLREESRRPVEDLELTLGTVYEKQGQPALALEYYQQALSTSQATGDPVSLIQTLTFTGSAYQSLNNLEQARSFFRQALAQCTDPSHDTYAAHALNLLGLSFVAANDHPTGLENFQQALNKLKRLNDREGMAESHYYIALSLLAQKHHAQSLENAQIAQQFASEIGKREWQWRSLIAIGQIQQALNHPQEAQQAYQAAISIIESMRGNLSGGEEQSQAFFETKTAPYLALADSLLAQNQPAQALSFAERAKARTLLDVLQSGKLNLAKAMTAAEQAQERQFNNELVALNTQLYREQTRETPDQQRLTALSAQVDKARLNYEDFRTRLYAAHPELKVQRGEAQPLTLAEAGALLPDARAALLEFVVLPERVQLFVITKTKTGAAQLQVFPLAVKREELSAKVAQFRQQLADRDQRFGRLARELYTLLLQPARAVLPPQTRLLIVPDGPLWELPFQALQKANNQYLWAEHVIAYAPSLTVLREMAKLKPAARVGKGKPSFFAIGDPALGGAGVERMKQLMAPVGGAFEQLPEARAQVETVRRFYDPARSRVLTGAAATEAVLKAEAGKYDVLHLATHGVLNDRNPLYSHVLLAQTESGAPTGAQTEDGLLEAWELMQMDLHAELAVLSACETARGRVGAGEGMIGLTWALFVAGVPTTIVSQWKVRADSTADLMVEFHRHWQTRPMGAWAKAEALQQAALRVQRDTRYQHPFYWAGFVLVGKTQ